jgi:hypothetical protein
MLVFMLVRTGWRGRVRTALFVAIVTTGDSKVVESNYDSSPSTGQEYNVH